MQVRRPMLLLGASLGSAMAVDFALAHPEAVAALVLVSPQCYTDGIGPMSALPRPVAHLGVAVRRKSVMYVFLLGHVGACVLILPAAMGTPTASML